MFFNYIAACENSRVLSLLLFVKNIIQYVFIIVPIILIIILAIDLAKIVFGIGEVKKTIPVIVSRMIASCSLFFVPLLVSLLTSFFGNVAETYAYCLSNATTENIEFFESVEKEKELLEKQTLQAEKETADKERKALAEAREKAREENEKKADEAKKNSSNSSGSIEGTAQTYKDVVWDVTDVTRISNLTSTQLIAVLNSKGGNPTNFIPYATDLITAENRYGVNVFFLIGIEALESGWVTSSISKSCNNLGGVCQSSAHPSNGCASNSNCKFAYFTSIGEFIDYHASMLSKNYLTPGGSYYEGKTPSAVVIHYCPGCSSWPSSVTSIANSLFNQVSKVM